MLAHYACAVLLFDPSCCLCSLLSDLPFFCGGRSDCGNLPVVVVPHGKKPDTTFASSLTTTDPFQLLVVSVLEANSQ